MEPGVNGGLGLMLVSTIAGCGAGSGRDDPSGTGAALSSLLPPSTGAGVDSLTPSGTRWDPSGCGVTGFAFSGAGAGPGPVPAREQVRALALLVHGQEQRTQAQR